MTAQQYKSESRNVDFSVLTWKFTRRDYEDGVQEEYELTANSVCVINCFL